MKLAPVLILLALAGCDQMRRQPRADAYEVSKLFANGQVEQAPPAGAIAVEDATDDAPLTKRPAMTAALLTRGRERYGIDCVMCHGEAGDGDGVVVSRGFPRPPSFASPRVGALSPEQVVDVITHGYGVMYPHADRVAPADRWAIAAYVQALQLAAGTPVGQLSDQDRAALEASHGG